MAGNKITREDLVEDKVFAIGPDYAKALEAAIEANVRFVASFEPLKKGILEIVNSQKEFQNVSNNQQFIAAKQKQTKAVNDLTTAEKVNIQARKALETAQEKERVANEALNKSLIKKRFELQQTNKEVKENAVLSSKLATEYQKQEVRLAKLRKAYKDLAIRQEIHGNLTKKEVEEMKRLEQQANKIDTALKKVDKSVGQSQRNVGNYQSALSGLGNTFRSLIGAFGITSGVMIFTQILRGAVANVKEFDSGLKNVQKTTGLTKVEITDLGEDIVNLSRKLETVGTKKLLEYATVAGQLGVKGSANILKFSEALAKLETASDISGEEGGASIARLLTLTDGGVENIADFGDEIVKLGNNFAATENEILSNATAIAQNTGIYKLGRQAVLAYATATKAVGIESEITGSTIGKTLGLIEKSLRTGQGLDAIVKLTGKNVEELKALFKEDAGAVFSSLLKGLNDVDKAGGSVNEQLEELGISAVRDQRVIGSLATAGYGTLARAMDDVTKASGALGEEFELASSKLENQFNRVGIAWDNFILSIEKGDGIIGKFTIGTLDALSGVMEGLSVSANKNVSAFRFWIAAMTNNQSELIRQVQLSTDIEEKNRLATKAIQDQTKAYAEQYGSLAPLTKEQTEFIANQERINLLEGGGSMQSYSEDAGATYKTIKQLQEELGQLNTELLDLNETDTDGIKIKQREIKVLQDKINALLGVSNATRKATKEQKDFNFETNKFINETKIKFLEDFAKNESNDFDLRQTALKSQADLEIALAEYVKDQKLKTVKKGTDEERDILVRFEAEKQEIIKRFEEGTDALMLAKIQQQGKTELAIRERLLNEELIQENEFFEATKDQYKDLEEATEAHEKRIADIKKRYAVEGLEAQISTLETLLATEKFTADERAELEKKISDYKKQISDINTETYKKEGKERVMTEEEVTRAVIDLTTEMAHTIVDILNNISQGRIDGFEREIEMSNARYDKLLENDQLYAEDRQKLEEAKALAEEKLQDKIKAEKRKQAIFDKALAVAQIGINTAVNISKVIPNPLLIALVTALGGLQLTAVLSTPIPQYEKGTDDHKGGLALVGEKRPEVIEEPGKAPYVISTPTVLDLPKGTKVTPSLEEYQKLMRASILSSVESSNDKMNAFQTSQRFDIYNSELVDKLEEVKKAVSRIKQNVIFKGTKAPDINFQIWKFKQSNWRA